MKIQTPARMYGRTLLDTLHGLEIGHTNHSVDDDGDDDNDSSASDVKNGPEHKVQEATLITECAI